MRCISWRSHPTFAWRCALRDEITVVKLRVDKRLTVVVDATRSGQRTSLLSEICSRFGHVFANPPVRPSILIAFVTFTLVYPYMQFMAVFAGKLGGGATGYGLLSSAIGIGSLIGSSYVTTGRGDTSTMFWSAVTYIICWSYSPH
jgi:hypothetical protein